MVSTSKISQILKSKSRFLTLEYLFAALASLLAAASIIEAVKASVALWNDSSVSFGVPLSWLLEPSRGYLGAIILGVAAVVLSLVALLLFQRTARSMPERSNYSGRQIYKLVTYGAFAIAAAWLVLLIVKLLAVIITSLLLIGSESSIAELYMEQFVPDLISIVILLGVAYFLYRSVLGRENGQRLASYLLVISGIVLFVLTITVAVQSHDGYTSNDYGRAEQKADVPLLPSDDIFWYN